MLECVRLNIGSAVWRAENIDLAWRSESGCFHMRTVR